MGALSAVVGRGLGVIDTHYGVKWVWLAWRGRCTESRAELETVNKLQRVGAPRLRAF